MSRASTRPLGLVTGASSGIGQAFAERLARDGHDLVVVARREDRLEDLKTRLADEHGASVVPLVADLSTETGMRAVDSAVADPRIDVVVDCAALAYYMPFLNLPVEKAEELVRLNVLAPVRLIRAALPGMVERHRGTIISTATQLVFSPTADDAFLPKRAVYAATKSFLFTFIQILAQELRDTGVSVQVLCPGVVKTEFHTRQNMDMSHIPRLEAVQVVDASMIALERGEVVCLPSLEDFDLLERHNQSEREILTGGMRPELAARYRET